jgi:hypothetical protein
MSSSSVRCEFDDVLQLCNNPTLRLFTAAQKKVSVGVRVELAILLDPSLGFPQSNTISLFTTLAGFSRFTMYCRELFLSAN